MCDLADFFFFVPGLHCIAIVSKKENVHGYADTQTQTYRDNVNFVRILSLGLFDRNVVIWHYKCVLSPLYGCDREAEPRLSIILLSI